MATVRHRIWEIVEVARPGDRVSRAFDIAILSLIFLNVVAVMLQSVNALEVHYGLAFHLFEVISVAVFTAEYVARLWSCVERPGAGGPILGRLHFALRPLPLLDLLAILPSFFLFAGVDLRVLRSLRMVRLVRVAKVGRYVSALQRLGKVLRAKRAELVLTSGLMLLLLVIASCLIYTAEHDAQPEQFPNIPAAMWWAIATLTTVGYGDVYPVTTAGKVLASVVAVLGIGLFALPAGILGSGFVEAVHAEDESPPPGTCPHCGREL